MTHSPTITALYRHPVKGFSPEPLDAITLKARRHVPFDRLYAIENGPSGFDPAAPAWRTKQKFLVLMTLPRLAELDTRFDETTSLFTLSKGGALMAEGRLDTAEGRAAIEQFLAALLADDDIGVPRVLKAPDGFRFTDSTKGFVSLVNRASIDAIAHEAGAALDPRRFRANLVVDDLPAFAEHELIGQVLQSGTVRLRVTNRTKRCLATTVNLDTAERDIMVPMLLQRRWGHADCGVYCEVLAGGTLKAGDRFGIEGKA